MSISNQKATVYTLWKERINCGKPSCPLILSFRICARYKTKMFSSIIDYDAALLNVQCHTLYQFNYTRYTGREHVSVILILTILCTRRTR